MPWLELLGRGRLDHQTFEPRFWDAIRTCVLVVLAAVPIMALFYYVRDKLGIHWRRWLSDRFLDRYFSNRQFYALNANAGIDNPDQRVAEDINTFTQRSLYFLLIFVGRMMVGIYYPARDLFLAPRPETLVMLAAVATRNFALPRGLPLKLALVAASLDVIANVGMLLALQASMLSLASVLISLYPAATVALAMVVLKERVRAWQAIGMALALGSVAMIAAG